MAERTLENNLCNLFAIVMSQCDSDTKNQIENMTKYLDIEAELDSIKLLGMNKQLIYAGGTKVTRKRRLHVINSKIQDTMLTNVQKKKW